MPQSVPEAAQAVDISCLADALPVFCIDFAPEREGVEVEVLPIVVDMLLADESLDGLNSPFARLLVAQVK